MDIQTKPLNDPLKGVQIILKGRLDIQSSEAVKNQLQQVIHTSAAVAIVTLDQVHFIDSAGLSALVSGLRLAREQDKDIVLVGLTKQAEMVFKLTMLDRIFSIYPTLDNALASLS